MHSHSIDAQTSPVLCTSAFVEAPLMGERGAPAGSCTPLLMCLNVSGFFAMSREYG
jgi:hypothetical protein